MASSPHPPPSSRIQDINRKLHTYPTSIIVHGIIWAFTFAIISPILSSLLFLKSCVVAVWTFLQVSIPLWGSRETVDVSSKEMAVCVTGCDSGFGRDVAFVLAQKGFVVFAGCFMKEGQDQFDGQDKIKPMKMDVTSDAEVNAVSAAVSKWISEAATDKKPRVLHAVINNAGIGGGSLVDWTDLKEYERCMSVNLYGMIRTTKAFLPLLKTQSYNSTHTSSRIINMVSMAGLVSGEAFSAYSCSKFAAEAFSSSLRLEMSEFGIQVVTVNPSFHKTPIVDGIPRCMDQAWEGLSEEKRKEYGQDFFNALKERGVRQSTALMWDADIVVEHLVEAVEQCQPSPQMLIGADAKYFIAPFLMLPKWLQDRLALFSNAGFGKPVRPAFVSGR